MIGRRKSLVIMAGITATILLATSAAFACTIFRGKMTVKGDAAATSVAAIGDGFGMGHCQPTGNPTGSASVSRIGGSVDVSVSPQDCGVYDGTLPDGNYTVNYFPTYPAFALTDCMNPIGQAGGMGVQMIGTLTVTSGSGSTTASLPAYAAVPGSQSTICLTSTSEATPTGMGVPITVI